MPTDGRQSTDREMIRRWVETWLRAGPELDKIRRREIETVDTREAIRQIFGAAAPVDRQRVPLTSGLVEQQAWFRKLRR